MNDFYGHQRHVKKPPMILKVFLVLIVLMIWGSVGLGVIEGFREARSESLYEAALNHYDKGEYEQSIVLLDKILDKDKKNFDALYAKGITLNVMEKYLEALTVLKEAEKVNGDREGLFSEIGYAYNNLGKYGESNEYYEKVLEVNKESTEALTWLAYNNVYMENYDEALKLCDISSELDNANAFTYNTRGLTYFYMGNLDEALTQYDKAIELDQQYEDAYLNKIYLLYYKGSYFDCINFCLESKEILKTSSEVLYYLGDCYSDQGQTEKAIEAYKDALVLNPANAELTARLGWEYYYNQDYKTASDYANKSSAMDKFNKSAQSLKEYLKKEEAPETEKVINFVKENYLYIDKVNSFEDKSKEFGKKTSVTPTEVAKFLQSIKVKEDPFTFVLSGNDYEEYMRYEAETHISSEQYNSSTIMIKIRSFTPNVDYEFKNIIENLTDTENTNLVIDLRDNFGGLTMPANSILDMLLPECTTSYLVRRDGRINTYYSGKGQIKFKRIVILVNENSASSSELLSLGLKKYLNNVTIIGRPTAGKGVGQTCYENKEKKYIIFLVNFYWNVKEQNIAGDRIHPDININTKTEEGYLRALNKLLN